MLSLGLSSSRYAEFMRTLATGYEFRVLCHLMSADRKVLGRISHLLLDGQIDCTAPTYNDGDPAVGRTARLVFLDPGKTLALDSRSPADGAFYMDRLIRVIYSVKCSFGWVDVPVFTGPVIKVDRDGDQVDVECHGMEHFAKGHAWRSMTRTGNKVAAMERMMNEAGEADRYLDFRDSKSNLIRPLTVARDGNFWGSVWRINQSLNRILYYDGRGVCVSRPKSGRVSVVLREGGSGGLIAAPTQVSYSTDGMVNAVQVTGAKGSKGKPTPQYRATPPRSHPLYPANLNRNGQIYVKAEFITNGELKSTAACKALAESVLEDHLSQSVDVSVESMPIPHLEPWDLIRVESPALSVQMRVLAWTLPLVQSSGSAKAMSIGHTRNVTRPRRPVRRR